jgi:hypothetical protein
LGWVGKRIVESAHSRRLADPAAEAFDSIRDAFGSRP